MKIVYAGTPDFAVAPLQKIIESGFEVVGVITQQDKPQGRKGILTPPPVKTVALEKGIPVLQPIKLRDEVEQVKNLGGDILITCAYGQILTQEVLDAFPLGVWNIHAGLLPKYRGASPIQSCILNGEKETGVSIMKTQLGLDCGDVMMVEKTLISPLETYGELGDRLSRISANVIINALQKIQSGKYTLTPQEEEKAQIVRKINKEQAKIQFNKTALEVVNLIRGMNPSPIAFTEIDGQKLNVYLAEEVQLSAEEQQDFFSASVGEILTDSPKRGLIVKCQNGAVRLTQVQFAGGKKITDRDLLNGRKLKKGQVFVC